MCAIIAPLTFVTLGIGEIDAHRRLINVGVVHLLQQSMRISTFVSIFATRRWLPFVAALRLHIWTWLFRVQEIGLFAGISSFLSFMVPSWTRYLIAAVPSKWTRLTFICIHKEVDVLFACLERREPGILGGSFVVLVVAVVLIVLVLILRVVLVMVAAAVAVVMMAVVTVCLHSIRLVHHHAVGHRAELLAGCVLTGHHHRVDGVAVAHHAVTHRVHTHRIHRVHGRRVRVVRDVLMRYRASNCVHVVHLR